MQNWDKGGTDYDVVTIKYDANGKPSATWPDIGDGVGVRRYDGAHRADWGKKVAVDSAGNVYVGATSSRLTARGALCSDFVILKYDADGNRKWCRRYNDIGDGEDALNDLAVDMAGNITITGSGKGSGHSRIVTVQYSAAGNRNWVQTYDGPGNGEDAGLCLTLDHLGNVYVAGYADLDAGTLNGFGIRIVTLKYSANGAQKWSQIDPTPWSNSKPTAIAVDAAGNVVAGNALGTNCGMRILVYDANGFLRWSKYERGRAPSSATDPFNMAHNMVSSRNGGIFVTGSLYNGAGACDDYATLRYSLVGTQYCFFLYDDPHHGVDIGTAIAVDGMGHFYVTGQAEGKSHRSITTVKYSW